jgi:hypothetical protein
MKSWTAMTLAFTLALQSITAWGSACPAPVSVLNEGDKAPCYGFLFSPAKEKELRLLNDDYILLQQKLDLTIKEMQLYKDSLAATNTILKAEQDKSTIWQQSAEKYSNLYTTQQDNRSNRDLICVALGIIITIAAAYGMGQAAKATSK